jgi:hypothetical protein
MFDILGASITIAASIVGVGIVIWDGFRRQRDSLEKTYGAMNIMNKYLENTSKAGVYEKIAILHGYTNGKILKLLQIKFVSYRSVMAYKIRHRRQ